MKNILKNIAEDKSFGNSFKSSENSPRFEMRANREIFMENYSSIAEYDDNLIKIIASKLVVCFWGKNLTLKFINDDALIISGIISSVEFESKGGKH